MVQFVRHQETGLYIADSNPASAAWWGFVVPSAFADPPKGPVALKDALENGDWNGALVYVAANADEIAENADTFVASIEAILAQQINAGALIFLPSGRIEDIRPTGNDWIPLSRFGGQITPNAIFDITLTGQPDVPGVEAVFNSNVALSVPTASDNACILFTPTNTSPAIELGGQEAPDQTPPPALTTSLWFEGDANGAFTFSLLIDQQSLNSHLNMGFQVVIPNRTPGANGSGIDPIPWLAAYLPLAQPIASRANWVGFDAQINIKNPNNLVSGASETAFFFTGQNGAVSQQPKTELRSTYMTDYGHAIVLTPVTAATQGQQRARLVVNPGFLKTPLQNGFRFAPAGDFQLTVPDAAAPPPAKALCGMSGTETIAFLPASAGSDDGERMRFVPNMPAGVPRFPLPPSSPVGPPVDPNAWLLDPTFLTSWTAFVAPPGDASRRAHYTAAPQGAELFGHQKSTVEGYLAPEDPGVGLPPDGSVAYPMFPISGFVPGDSIQDVSSEEMQLLSRQIISPTRKAAIAASGQTAPSSSADISLSSQAGAASDDQLVSTTTPTGFITRYSQSSGHWKQLLLAQVLATSVTDARQMGFVDLNPKLTAAFQTTDQFLVVANKAYLGTPAPASVFMQPLAPDLTQPARFFNHINIGKWNFAAQVGQRNEYGDYRSVMLVKGVKGKILDVDPLTGAATQDSLVMNPEKWTMKNDFAAPSSEKSDADLSQLVPLSSWLVDYCQDAYANRDSPYFANFARIITDENWTGVLILKAEIDDVPSDLAGILAGVKDPSDFYAHHIGIEISQIEKEKIEVRDTTSMFGLVYYIDPRYDDSKAPHTISAGDPSAEQDFTLLTLKALFENSAIKTFDSLAQIVLNSIFGSAVEKMQEIRPEGRTENVNNAVLLEGGVQKNGDAVLYSLASKWPNQYFLANNVLTSVEIDTAQMSTRDDGLSSGTVVSWIGMSGYMNFAMIQPPPPQLTQDPQPALPDFDIFSFGPDDGDEDALRQGLNFDNLGLRITVPAASSGDTSETSPAILQVVESEIAFNTDPVSSHFRDQSLYKGFQLELQGLLSGDASADGDAKSSPAGLGFAPVITEYKLRDIGSGSGKWHGLKFKLNLGTPGNLAGKVNLNSSLLLAWADDSGAGGPSPGQTVADTRAMVGIELPGAGVGGELFSLQTVIKLSIGLMQLTYTAPGTGHDANPGGYLLVLNQIALKLLGLLKIPPSGNTAFLLFGNPEATDLSGLGWFAMYNKELSDNKLKKDAGSEA